MAHYKDIVAILREQGLKSMISRDTANALFPKVSQTRQESLLGLQKLGEGFKYDDISIKVAGAETTKGPAKAVELNEVAQAITASGISTQTLAAIATKETIDLQTSNLIAINAAEASQASDAELEAIARQVVTAVEDLVGRSAMTLEKTFWEGVFGLMQITKSDDTILQIPTNTVVQTALTSGAKWDAPSTAAPLDDIDAMKSEFRGTGLRAQNLIMNQATYDAFVAADSVQSDFGEAIRGAMAVGGNLPGIKGLNVQVYDDGFVDESDNFTPYIPDGFVVVEGVSPLGTETVRKYDCINVDDRNGKTYGSFLDVIEEKNPTKISYYHSYFGLPVFTAPQAFVSLQVF